MKKIFLIYKLLLCFFIAQSQISQRCPVCPPSLNGVTNGAVLTDSSGHARWQVHVSDSSSFWELIGNDIHNTNIGNVGIGTATPNDKLEINGNAIVRNMLIVGDPIVAPSSQFTINYDTTNHAAFLRSVDYTLGYTPIAIVNDDFSKTILLNVGETDISDFINTSITTDSSASSLLQTPREFSYNFFNKQSGLSTEFRCDSMQTTNYLHYGGYSYQMGCYDNGGNKTQIDAELSVFDGARLADVSGVYAQPGQIRISAMDTSNPAVNVASGIFTYNSGRLNLDVSNGLTIDGTLRYTDGTQGAGKVLSSDAIGNASWTKITATNQFDFSALPQYANNAAALLGGLTVGQIYIDNSYHITVVHN